MVTRAIGFAALVLCGTSAGCGPSRSASRADADALGSLARAALAHGCKTAIAAPPVPTLSAHAGGRGLAVYTAHPDDEAMYGGGTMAAVAHAGHPVAVVVMSHGEGGRLLELGADGKVVERRDMPEPDVARLRDEEIARAMATAGIGVTQLYPAAARVDYAWTTECSEALAHWDSALPGGVRGMLERIVKDVRARRPRVVMTLDPRDDPQASHHGHHKAVGMLVELAVRAAADPAVTGLGPPHVVEEVLAFAPKGVRPDVTLDVGPTARVTMLAEYPSQFRDLDELATRSVEELVLRWRAVGVTVPPSGSVIAELAGISGSSAAPTGKTR